MKKIFCLFFLIFLLTSTALAEEPDEFDNAMGVFNSQRKIKPVTDQEVQQALKQLQEKKDKRLRKKKKKKIEGTVLSNEINHNMIEKPYLLLQITRQLYNDGNIIPQGFYTVGFDQSNNTLLLKQGYNVISAIKMTKSQTEPDGEGLYYIKILPCNNGTKFLYGEIEKHFEAFCRFTN